ADWKVKEPRSFTFGSFLCVVIEDITGIPSGLAEELKQRAPGFLISQVSLISGALCFLELPGRANATVDVMYLTQVGYAATDIHADPSYGRTTDPDMVLISSPDLDVILAHVAAQATQIGISPVAAGPPGTNMVPDDSSDPWYQHSPR
ncbi:hypothetical protein STEG23_017302, partial [Scotinomys teguina]